MRGMVSLPHTIPLSPGRNDEGPNMMDRYDPMPNGKRPWGRESQGQALAPDGDPTYPRRAPGERFREDYSGVWVRMGILPRHDHAPVSGVPVV